MSALTIDGLGRRYGTVWGLRDCRLDLPAGRVAALVGPNGAGKTTLLELIVGLLAPTEGSVRVFGQPVAGERAETKALVGFVAQDHPLYAGFRVSDLLEMGRRLNPRWDQALAEDRLAQVGIPPEKRAGHLSGGQRAQVCLTLALAKRPRLLILDEPAAGLDPVARHGLMSTLMGAVAEDGLTVVLSSHVVSELERVCDHVVLLRNGRVELAGDLHEVMRDHQLLVGPRIDPGDAGRLPGIVSAAHGSRQSHLLIRGGGGQVHHPRWEAHTVTLEQIVLAYLSRGDEASGVTP